MRPVKSPNVINAPAGNIIISAGSYELGITCILNSVPAPSNSLMEPNIVRERVKPNPIPKPSTIEGIGGFLDANVSALANIIQFTTIRGIKMPKLSYKSGRYASITIPTIVTNVAIITIYDGIRIFEGIKSLSRDIT